MNGQGQVILFQEKAECCGCMACVQICARHAIFVKTDEEGFDYPEVDEMKCVRCRMCLRVCPIK